MMPYRRGLVRRPATPDSDKIHMEIATDSAVRGAEGPPTIMYTVMPDFGGAWAWSKPLDRSVRGVGRVVGSGRCWTGRHPLPGDLVRDFAAWQDWFERQVPTGLELEDYPLLPWRLFHQEGWGLCLRLKQRVREAACVRYSFPLEDPFAPETPDLEFFADGSFGPVTTGATGSCFELPPHDDDRLTPGERP